MQVPQNSSGHQWSFLDADSKIPLTEIAGALNLTKEPIVIPFKLIGRPGTKIIIQLTAQSTTSVCEEIITDLLFTVPTIEVEPTKVSIDKDEFCINDSKYPLTITPAGANPEVSGNGITVDRLFFDPALTVGKTGPFRLFYKGVQFASVNVLTPPVIQINSQILVKDKMLTVSTEAVNGNGYLWSILDPEKNNPHTNFEGKFDEKAPSLRLPFELFGEAGSRVKIRLIVRYEKHLCKYSVTEEIYRVTNEGVLEQEPKRISKENNPLGGKAKF